MPLTAHPDRFACRLMLADVQDRDEAVARCRRLLDLDADPAAIDAVLAADDVLAERVAAAPGRRATVLRLARALADGEVDLTADDARERLLALPGIGPWTADTVAMRAGGRRPPGQPTARVIRPSSGSPGRPWPSARRS